MSSAILRAQIDLRQTSFSLRITEDRDVNVSSQAVKFKEHPVHHRVLC